MRISVFGTGYVGLVTAVGLANTGKDIICIDNDQQKIDLIKKGISPIYERDLENLLTKNLDRIEATTDSCSAVRKSDVVFIAVGTPFDGEQIDLSCIKQASKEIGDAIKFSNGFKTIVVKSTVIPGTTVDVVRPIVLKQSGKTDKEVGFAMNPEFLREGNAVEDFISPDRIVLGITSAEVEIVLRDVYSGFTKSEILVTNPTTAEIIKYTANSFLALTISYANEVARICEKLPDVDSEKVFRGVIMDKRISPLINGERIVPGLASYLRAGIGFGGSCFPKDVKAFKALSDSFNVDGKLLSGLLYINETQLKYVFQTGLDKFKGKVKRITILGTAFKPDTDDIRESPGILLAELALKNSISVAVHDFIAISNTKKYFGDRVEYFDEPLEAVRTSDIVFVTTIWPQYQLISDEDFEKNLKEDAILIDTRSHFKERPHKPWRYRIGYNK